MNIVKDITFDRMLSQDEKSFLLGICREGNTFDINDIKKILLENNKFTGEEGYLYYELKNNQFETFVSSGLTQLDFETIKKEIENNEEMKELINDHTMCTAFLTNQKQEGKYVHPIIKEKYKKLINYIKEKNLDQEVIYFNVGPKGFVPPHTDGKGHVEFYTAVINLRCPPEGAEIRINERVIKQYTNDIFLFNTHKIHSALNPSEKFDWEFLTIRLKTFNINF